MLEARRRKRRVSVSVPHFLFVLELVRNSDPARTSDSSAANSPLPAPPPSGAEGDVYLLKQIEMVIPDDNSPSLASLMP